MKIADLFLFVENIPTIIPASECEAHSRDILLFFLGHRW